MSKERIAQRVAEAMLRQASHGTPIANYSTMGGYSMADASSYRGTRIKAYAKLDDGEYIITLEGEWTDSFTNNMSGKGKDKSAKLFKRFKTKVTQPKFVASAIENEMYLLVKKYEFYNPKQWALPNKRQPLNTRGIGLTYVLGRTLKTVK